MDSCVTLGSDVELTREEYERELSHRLLLERLKDDDAVTIATVASWAIYKRYEKPKRVWWAG
jgi:hypothetical protein